MTSNEILKADLLDIIFENRNKQYGAYALRKEYNARMWLSVGIAISLFFAVFLLIRPMSSGGNQVAPFFDEGHILTDVELDPAVPQPPAPLPQPATQQQTRVAQVQYHNLFRIVPNDVTSNIATQSDLEGAVIGSIHSEGPPAPNGNVQPPQAGNGGAAEIREPETPKAPLPSSAPEFPGGMSAWLAFLSRHLHSPSSLEPGEKKTVMVQFYVDTEGNITNFKIVQSAGKEYDNEVIRVLKKMPRWKPAIQNGVAVPVSFTQPVTFMGLEE